MGSKAALWVGFHVFVVAMVVLDLGVIRRKSRPVNAREATVWTLAWIGISLAFDAGIYLYAGRERALEFLTGYVVEYSLSVDNLFVFLLLFSYFKVAPEHRHRLLFWGILGQFAMRAPLIILGTTLVARVHWVLYLFGAFLLYTAAKMVLSKEEEMDPEQSAALNLLRRVLPLTRINYGSRFFVREGAHYPDAGHVEHATGKLVKGQLGRLRATPMFLVLVVLNVTDLMFAFDSIPAVMGVSKDPFVVYTSNVCAIFGLRSLFFVVASLMDKFHYLKPALSVILAFVGVKMLIERWYAIHIVASLLFIAAVLGLAIVASAVWPPKEERPPPSPEQ